MSDDVPTLNNLNLKIKRGELFGVVGRVGSGKSSFISAILGDMNKLDGNVAVRGKVAYVPQQPWIINATVQDNITFGHRFDPEFYEETISACALKPDLEMLASGDQTEIGERGINLSGGQKARISMARAVYARADIYLLDDPLSAVDAHVGRHLFTRVLGKEGILRNKTRVLVTHAIHFLPVLDTIAMFENGRINEIGTFNELKANESSAIHQLITAKAPEENAPPEKLLGQSMSRLSVISHHELLEDTWDGETSSHIQHVACQAIMRPASVMSVQLGRANAELGSNQDKLMTVEESSQGSVQASVYLKYFKACSLWGIIFYLLLALLTQITSLLGISWVDSWSNVNSKSEVAYNVGIYGLIALVSGFFTFTQYLTLYMLCGLRAAKSTHGQMLMAVIRAPMSFFDTTPLGRIMNRFSKDQSSIDEILPRAFGSYISTAMRVIFTVIVISYSTPPFLALIVLLGFFYFKMQGYYLTSSRELKRLDSTTRSPIFSHFQETLAGVASIRAYEQQQRFAARSEKQLEANLEAYYLSLSVNRWLGVRLEFLGAIIIFSAALLAVLTLAYGLPIAPKVVGMSLTYALNVTQSLNWVIRQYCDIETNIVAMERIQEYIELPSEAPYEAISCSELPMNSAEQAQRVASAPIDWPSKGSVEFQNYSTRYRPGLDLILKGLSIEINPGEKVGIVGRTGAGKSSLTLALFRIIEAAQGSILVDGIDISTLGLFDLRSRISIIPQDPVVFGGTVRDNLDPFGSLSDDQLWRALEHANLKDYVLGLEGKLDASVAHGGENFSVGQRQLICLARALLRKSSILVLDEATAAIDFQTDNLIQATIREAFGHCTVFTIAHRTNTVMDGDKILVLDQGQVKEYDSPSSLLSQTDSLFYGLAKEAGIV
ncbi:hypothetical protein DSO57_1029153 [Entomophthora muscae]|uniref:Uncharacterized protein n=1 Tax=Entomophthora muscae TaxID=34485 RepID=A0ACC2UL47_9FUNG|nr:hypothetical protein DSO57_1029153 [Entomophthora muscae]